MRAGLRHALGKLTRVSVWLRHSRVFPLVLALFILAGAATWFAAESSRNWRQAEQWSQESRAWQGRASEIGDLLQRSEEDVRRFEARQIDLAREKMDSEQAAGFASLEASKIHAAGELLVRCSDGLTELLQRPGKWAELNRPSVFSYCRQARKLWRKYGSS